MSQVFIGLLLLFSALQVVADDMVQPRTPEEMEFVKQNNERSRAYLYSDTELVNKVKARAAEIVPQNAPVRTNYFGQDYMFSKGSLVRANPDGTPGDVIIDIATLPAGAGAIDYRISPDQSKIVFGYSIYGTDWQTWQIMDIASKTMVDEPFQFKNTGNAEMSWMPDSKAVIYERSLGLLADLEARRKPGVMLHKLGTAKADDIELFAGFEELDSSRWNAKAFDKNSVVVYRDQGVAEIPFSAFLVSTDKSFKTKALVPANKYFGRLVGIRDGWVFIRTSECGPNYGIIAVNGRTGKQKKIVPAYDSESLYQAFIIGDKILTQYLDENLSPNFRVFNLSGKMLGDTLRPSDFGLSKWGNPSLPLVSGDASSTAAYFTYSSVDQPTVTLKFDADSGKVSALPSKEVPFAGSKIKSEIIYYPSHDGAMIPMYVASRADREGPAAYAYLYNYGFIGIPNLPQYNRKFQLALDMGAIVAIPMVRGGGEFGLNWQLQGTYDRFNTLKDVVYASRWLKKHYDIKCDRVALSGRSFGGTTTFSEYVLFQNEFDAFTPVCGISDLAKFIRDESGWWAGDDFGIKRDENGKVQPEDYLPVYAKLDEWSALPNLDKVKTAKPMMAFGQEHDTRVGPQQTVAIVKALREKMGAGAPIYMIELEKGGHNTRAELTDEILFLMKTFGITEFTPVK